VTQPDRPAGRGQRLTPSPVKRAALDRGLRVYEPHRLRDFAREIESLAFDAFVVASYGKILPAALLAMPSMGALNVHPSLLPRYRGATPIQAALLAGDTETGVTIMLMDEGMDTGDIVLQEHVAVESHDDFGSLHARLAMAGASLLLRALDAGRTAGAFNHRPQEGQSSVTRPIAKGDLQIDWAWSARRIVDHVRAYAPQPAARAEIAGVSVKMLKARIGEAPDALAMTCGDGTVAIEVLVAPNHARETGAAFARRMDLTP
jgi:methionyl-tRNA formyltransferase